MKQLLQFLLASLLLLTCTGMQQCHRHQGQTPDNGDGDSQQGTSQTSGEASAAAEFHYVVEFRFTKVGVTPQRCTRQEGEAPLLVVPSNDMFFAIFRKGKLAFYQDMIDPLSVRPTGGQGEPSQADAGSASLLLPAWVAEEGFARESQLAIYKVLDYVPDFQAKVADLSSVKSAGDEGLFRKAYELDAAVLSAFVRKSK
jgi:hypothetical protein